MFGGFKKMLYLCKLKEKPPFSGKNARDWIMKDRIRQIMESKHMTQQVFADYIGTTPATLSGIFNDRTRPTINIVESIKRKFLTSIPTGSCLALVTCIIPQPNPLKRIKRLRQ